MFNKASFMIKINYPYFMWHNYPIIIIDTEKNLLSRYFVDILPTQLKILEATVHKHNDDPTYEASYCEQYGASTLKLNIAEVGKWAF